MTDRTRVAALTAGAVAAAGVAAAIADPSASSSDQRRGGTFAISVPAGALQSIDPRGPAHTSPFGWATCELPVGFRQLPPPASYRLVPHGAATLPRISRDRRTYTLTIRRGVRFHNGSPV